MFGACLSGLLFARRAAVAGEQKFGGGVVLVTSVMAGCRTADGLISVDGEKN